jgi:CRP/FNR family transcriptional regulator
MRGFNQDQFPFLGGLSDGARAELLALVPRRVEPEQALLRRGDAAAGAYFVVGGALRVYYVTPAGREATLYRVEAGGTCIAALTSTFNEEPYPAWVNGGPLGGAYIRVPSALFLRLFDAEPAFRNFVLRVLSGRVLELMQVLEETGSALMEQRVARYLLKRADPSGSVQVSQSALAAELGTAREVVFRALRALAARQLVETARRRISIVDAPGLRRVAEP